MTKTLTNVFGKTLKIVIILGVLVFLYIVVNIKYPKNKVNTLNVNGTSIVFKGFKRERNYYCGFQIEKEVYLVSNYSIDLPSDCVGMLKKTETDSVNNVVKYYFDDYVVREKFKSRDDIFFSNDDISIQIQILSQ